MTFTKYTTKALRKWLKDNGFSVGCRLGIAMAYDPNEEYIMLSKRYDDSAEAYFENFLKENGLVGDYDIKALIFLHELGHHETYHSFTSEEWESDMFIKELIMMSDEDEEELFYKYWSTDTEWEANQWLINYATYCASKVQELAKIFRLSALV